MLEKNHFTTMRDFTELTELLGCLVGKRLNILLLHRCGGTRAKGLNNRRVVISRG